MSDEKNESDHVKTLRELGFPEKAIESSEAARKAGLFEREPPPDMLERIIEHVKPLLPPAKPKPL